MVELLIHIISAFMLKQMETCEDTTHIADRHVMELMTHNNINYHESIQNQYAQILQKYTNINNTYTW